MVPLTARGSRAEVQFLSVGALDLLLRVVGGGANVDGAAAIIAAWRRDVTFAAGSRSRTSFGLASSLMETGAINVVVSDKFFAFGAFFALDEIRHNFSCRLPRADFVPVRVFGVFFAQKFVHLQYDRLLFFWVGRVLGSVDCDGSDVSDVSIFHFHHNLLDETDVFAGFGDGHCAMALLIQTSAGEHNFAFLHRRSWVVNLLWSTGANDLDFGASCRDWNILLVVVRQLGILGQVACITNLHSDSVSHLLFAHLQFRMKFADGASAAAFVLLFCWNFAGFTNFIGFFLAFFRFTAFDGFAASSGTNRFVHRLQTLISALARLGIGLDAFGWFGIIFASLSFATSIIGKENRVLARTTLFIRRAIQRFAV